MVITGIDYSLRSPAICTHMGTTWNYSNCIFYFLSDRKKYSDVFSRRFFGKSFDSFSSEEERYDSISSWAVDICDGVDQVGIENYAYNATGRVFNIAENTGVLKYKLFQLGIPLECFSPSKVKKFGSGKGNASKDLMYESFVEETNVNLIEELNMKSLGNPVTDIVDSYYICKLLFYELDKMENIND